MKIMEKPMSTKETIILQNLTDNTKLASQIASEVQPGFFLLLSGDLGAGKTTFTKTLLAQLGVKERVGSPTFVIMNEYATPNLRICHLDAYRLQPTDDLFFYLDEPAETLNIIEWPEKLTFNYQAYPLIKLTFQKGKTEQERLITIEREY